MRRRRTTLRRVLASTADMAAPLLAGGQKTGRADRARTRARRGDTASRSVHAGERIDGPIRGHEPIRLL